MDFFMKWRLVRFYIKKHLGTYAYRSSKLMKRQQTALQSKSWPIMFTLTVFPSTKVKCVVDVILYSRHSPIHNTVSVQQFEDWLAVHVWWNIYPSNVQDGGGQVDVQDNVGVAMETEEEVAIWHDGQKTK